MRAYLSTADGGRRVYGIFRDDLKEQAALDEARAILAENEPGILPLVGTPYEQSVPLWCRTFRRDRDNPFRRAMKESLARFIEAEV